MSTVRTPLPIPLGLALCLAAGASCATNPAPRALRVSEQESVVSGLGAYALLTFTTQERARGELLAVSADTIWILPYDKPRMVGYAKTSIQSVVLAVHDNHGDALKIWAAAGAISTISHGVGLLLTLPLWLVTGIPMAVSESHRGIVEYRGTFPDLNIYARFPQGLPPSVAAVGHGTRPLIQPSAAEALEPAPGNMKTAVEKINARPE